MYSAMSIHLLQSDSRRDKGVPRDDDDARFDRLVELIERKISRLKALHAAWVEFCSGLRVIASDVDTMIGMPFMGRLEQLEPVQEIVGSISPNEEYQQECLNHMRNFWKTKLEDRYNALG